MERGPMKVVGAFSALRFPIITGHRCAKGLAGPTGQPYDGIWVAGR